jgi:iron complex outermembrane receptor protein
MVLGGDPEFEAETYPNTVDVLNEQILGIAPGTPGAPAWPVWWAQGLANNMSLANPDDRGDAFWRNAIKWGTGELNTFRRQLWTNTSYAAYTHADLEVWPDITIQGGVRYSHEGKTREGVDKRVYFSSLPFDEPLPVLTPNLITAPVLPYGDGTFRAIFEQEYSCGRHYLNVEGQPVPYNIDCDRWTPEAGIRWQITDEHMTYFRYAQGWKSGGLRQEALNEQTNNSAAFVLPYEPETVNSFEVGVRTQWLDNQVLLNATLFYNDYQNMQVTSIEPNDNGLVTALINNAESAVTRGFEIEGVYIPEWAEKIPLEGSFMVFTAGIGFTDAFYKKFVGSTVPNLIDTGDCVNLVRGECDDRIIDTFAISTVLAPLGLVPPPKPIPVDFSGNSFKNTPRINTNASFTYSFDPMNDMTLAARLDWSYRSTIYYTTQNDPDLASDPLHLLNGSLIFDITATNTQVSIWAKNLTNQIYLSGALSLGRALGTNGLFFSKGRTYGIRFRQEF